ncbi:MAG: ferrous iron transport protein B [Anaerolineales bacterium]|jgi:ferrous iron transport protein B
MQCHSTAQAATISSGGSIALVGHPNVGKSVLFNLLTGQHAAISNYPGTTVEVARGTARSLSDMVLVDTPGVVTFPPHSEDEQVTARVILNESPQVILQVGDAKNLRRTLLLTAQLAEMGLPLVVALNMMDEAAARGVRVDDRQLARRLNIQVVPTTAIHAEGIDALTSAVRSASACHLSIEYPQEVEAMLAEFERRLAAGGLVNCPISPRSLGLLWLCSDAVSDRWLAERLRPGTYQEMLSWREARLAQIDLADIIQQTRQEFVDEISAEIIVSAGKADWGFSQWLGHLTTHPIWGMFILILVLFSLYWFVGIFGAGTLVDALETRLFGEWINPWVTGWVNHLVPWRWAADLLVGEYGLWTMGMTYALALILPIVTTFFLAFGIMEDSGYLPRLAALSNRMFQSLGLNGKAVLPMVLGLGCVTMATVTTRVMESRRERLLVTLLLALAVPCSAQLGVVMGMLAGISLAATLIWSSVVLGVLFAVGWLAARLIPGERNQLLVELPPLRLPMFSNVLTKTLARIEWYLREVVPLFLLGTLIMFLMDKSGALSVLIDAAKPLVVDWLGLPAQASAAFFMGFLRRDFGATGLFVMESQGLLSPRQVVVAMVTVTLFVPCIASVMMIAKERDWKTALGMLTFIFPLAFIVGGLLSRGLTWLGWGL